MNQEQHPHYGTPVPAGWKVVTLDDLKAKEKHSCVAGPFGSSIGSKYFVDTGVPVIRGSNLRDDLTQFVPDGFAFVSHERAKTYAAQHVRAGDLVFTCWGTIGQVGLIPDAGPFNEYIISNKQLKLRPDPNLVDVRFLYYQLASPASVSLIKSRAVGSAVPGINLGILKGLPVCIPPLPTQRRIASILSAYDDLIENNTKRIKILEEMARALYREWFVHFRFPGHEEVKLVDSPLGQIPKGWRVAPVSAVAATHRGRSYRKDNLVEQGGHPFLNLKNIARDGGFRREGTKRYKGPFKPEQRARAGDIIVAVTDMTQERRLVGHAARVPQLDADFAVYSMDLVRVAPVADTDPEYLYSFLRCSPFSDNVKNCAHGTNVLHLNPDRITDFEWYHAPRNLQTAYGVIVQPMRLLADVLSRKNDALRQTRDLLLPRLISGELDVSTLPLPKDA